LGLATLPAKKIFGIEEILESEREKVERILKQGLWENYCAYVGDKITIFDGTKLPWRTPFGEWGERKSSNWSQTVVFGNKGRGDQLRKVAEEVLGTNPPDDFKELWRVTNEAISQRVPILVSFNMPKALFEINKNPPYRSRENFISRYPFASLEGGYKIAVFISPEDYQEKSREEILWEKVVYPYLYCVGNRKLPFRKEVGQGTVGIDCSCFVYYSLERAVKNLGGKLQEMIINDNPGMKVPQGVGVWFYKPYPSRSFRCSEKIADLRPGQIILFGNSRREMSHSAVIYDVLFDVDSLRLPFLFPQIDFRDLDLSRINERVAVVVYMQSTDWVKNRGVNMQCFIYPMSKVLGGATIKDNSGQASALRSPAFEGETLKGTTQLWRIQNYGGMVVVLKAVKEIVEKQVGKGYYPLYSG